MKRIMLSLCILLLGVILIGCDNLNYYKLTITGFKDGLVEAPQEGLQKAGKELIIKSGIITDVGLFVFVNNQEIDMEYSDEYWIFKFTMPECDTIVHITTDQFYGKNEYFFNELFYWADSLTTDNIKEIKISSRHTGTSPETFTINTYTNDSNDISNILSIFDKKLIICDEPIEPGALKKTYYFTTKDGGIYELIFFDKKIWWYDFSSSQTFTFDNTDLSIPIIENPYKETLQFEYFGDASKIYKNDETKEIIYDRIYGIDLFEFIEIKTDLTISDASYYLEGENGTQYLIDTKRFIFKDKCYLIVGEYDLSYFEIDLPIYPNE